MQWELAVAIDFQMACVCRVSILKRWFQPLSLSKHTLLKSPATSNSIEELPTLSTSNYRFWIMLP